MTMRAQIFTIAVLAATAATSAADPIKSGGHELDFTRPAKLQAMEQMADTVFIGVYTGTDPVQRVGISVMPHTLAEGPADLAKLVEGIDAQMSRSGLKADARPAATTAGGFVALSHQYLAKDPKKPNGAFAVVVDGGTFIIVVSATTATKPDELSKLVLETLATVKVDGKKGPAPYKK